MPISDAQKRATAKYKKKAYDRIEVSVPKGERSVFASHAASMGESMNAFLLRSMQETMARDKENKD